MATAATKAVATHPAWQPEHLPPFPSVALKALNLMAGTETSLPDLCNLIRSDSAFSTEVLKIANSPLIAFSKQVTSILQASMLLGFRRLRSVVITVGLKAYLSSGYTPVLKACWRHSVACALIAERVSKLCSLDKDFAYTAGVMHDIGRVALAAHMPKVYNKIMDLGADTPYDLLQAERECCGIDHCEAGRTLATAWGLPEIFQEITAHHHKPEWEGRGTIRILPACCALADSLGFGVIPFRAPRDYSEILAALPEAARFGFPPKGEQLATDVTTAIKLLETI